MRLRGKSNYRRKRITSGLSSWELLSPTFLETQGKHLVICNICLVEGKIPLRRTGSMMWARSSMLTRIYSTTVLSSLASYSDLHSMLGTLPTVNRLWSFQLTQTVSSSTRSRSMTNSETQNFHFPLIVKMARKTQSSTVRLSTSLGTLRTLFLRSSPRGSLSSSDPRLSKTSS